MTEQLDTLLADAPIAALELQPVRRPRIAVGRTLRQSRRVPVQPSLESEMLITILGTLIIGLTVLVLGYPVIVAGPPAFALTLGVQIRGMRIERAIERAEQHCAPGPDGPAA